MKEEVLETKVEENGSLTKAQKGLEFRRYFTREGMSPYDTVEWEYRTAAITSESGEVIFEQKNVEVPKSWSMTATNIVASKYFHGKRGAPERESSVRQLVGRVATTITAWGRQGGYFATEQDAAIFHDELAHLLLNQMMAFNSPVWFNCGIEVKPQCSACFINSVEDTMGSILDLAKTEGMLFKWGSGTGSNLSPIRSSNDSGKADTALRGCLLPAAWDRRTGWWCPMAAMQKRSSFVPNRCPAISFPCSPCPRCSDERLRPRMIGWAIPRLSPSSATAFGSVDLAVT